MEKFTATLVKDELFWPPFDMVAKPPLRHRRRQCRCRRAQEVIRHYACKWTAFPTNVVRRRGGQTSGDDRLPDNNTAITKKCAWLFHQDEVAVSLIPVGDVTCVQSTLPVNGLAC
jgi:hypothetical protein